MNTNKQLKYTNMKQKTIIQVWGHQGCGKSTTIKILKEELTLNYVNPSHSYILPIPNGEISDTILCKGYKVGIESMGDYLWAYGLKERLDNFILSEHCDILICASRVYNNVSKHIEYLAKSNDYRLLKYTNYREVILSFSQNDLNQLSAQHLLDLVDKILIGHI